MIPTPSPAEQRDHVYKLLKKFKTAMLVTHGEAEHLHIRPMAIALVEDEGDVWFVSSVDTAKVHEIEHDTRVNLVCQEDHSAYLSIEGRARLVKDRPQLEKVWSEPMKVWFPGGKDDPSLVMIAVTPESGEFWDNAGVQKFKYLFESVRAYLTGTTPNVEDGNVHGRAKL